MEWLRQLFTQDFFTQEHRAQDESMAALKAIAGLGNPGPQYARNRHNLGFQTLELFGRRHGIEIGKMQNKALLGDGWISRRGERAKVLLIKPLTFMNNSGDAIGPLARYYDITPENLLVVVDDLDITSGQLRLRPNGSSGGQNGLKSIIRHLGTQDFAAAARWHRSPARAHEPRRLCVAKFQPS